MHVVVDRERCVGSGMCTAIAPTVFDLDQKGALVVLVDALDGAQSDDVRAAIACCPVDALRLT